MRNFTEPEKTVIILLFFISCLFFFWSINYYLVNGQELETSYFEPALEIDLIGDTFFEVLKSQNGVVYKYYDSFGEPFYSIECWNNCVYPIIK